MSITRRLARLSASTFSSSLRPRTRPPSLLSHPTSIVPSRFLATVKHVPNFKPPSTEDLSELRERVREFTSRLLSTEHTGHRELKADCSHLPLFHPPLEREIPEEVAAKVDKDNEFPAYMWKRLGEAG